MNQAPDLEDNMNTEHPLLSDMDRAVLCMPMSLAFAGEIAQAQYYSRVQALVQRVDATAHQVVPNCTGPSETHHYDYFGDQPLRRCIYCRQQETPNASRLHAEPIQAPEGGPPALTDEQIERIAISECIHHVVGDSYKFTWSPGGRFSVHNFARAVIAADRAALAAQHQAPLSERAILDLVPSTMPMANDFDLLWFARAVERAHGIPAPQTKEPKA